MSDTTSIDDLPMSSQHNHLGGFGGGGMGSGMGGGAGGSSSMVYSPNVESAMSNTQYNQQPQIPPNVMNEVMHGVQKASANGMTMIPTRDIPMNPNAFTHDEQIKPNYVPDHNMERDYIREHTSMEGIIRDNARSQNRMDTIEAIYIDFQIPILLGVMYFIFQMPVFRAQLLHFLPSMFAADGNLNIVGLTGTSVMFAVSYFIIMKLFNKLGEGIR